MFPSRRHPWFAIGALCFAIGLHLLLWRLLLAPAPPRVQPPTPVRVAILRIATPVMAPPQAPTAVGQRLRNAPRFAQKPPLAGAPSITPTAPVEAPASAETAALPAVGPASAALPSLLDTAATRRAIREAARQPSAADLGDAPIAASQRLSDAMVRSAKGDCLKGDFAGGGMGLLSLPFWALAQLREQCGK